MRKSKIIFYVSILLVATIALVITTESFWTNLLINTLGIIIFIIIAKIAKGDPEFKEWLDDQDLKN